jgi:hypothetical protein
MTEYKCEIVTPAGRKRYIEILYKYLKNQKEHFDVWQLWLNTTDKKDIEYMKQLEIENSWIRCIDLKIPHNGYLSIHSFFEETKDENTIYIRLDDDIVYISPNFIKEMKEIRLKNKETLFIYPNIINNAIISHLHYRNSLIEFPLFAGYECMDNVGWKNPKFCEAIHKSFLKSIEENEEKGLDLWRKSFNIWSLNKFERVSINCIAWFGNVMKNNIIKIDPEEEQDIASEIPKKFNIYNFIYNGPICAHYAFYPQRDYIDSQTNILERYRKLADKYL